MDTPLVLSARSIAKRYPRQDRFALSDVSADVRRGELIAVIGHNGAGKSTLFEILGLLTRPTAGAVTLHVSPSDVGWCPQREIIDWSLTVRQNISLGLELRRRYTRGDRLEHTVSVAEALGLRDFLDRTAETLSGGELRRTQIARAMVGDPKLMILDEPTTGLDPQGMRFVFENLSVRTEDGATALISTHETSRFASYCTRVIAISKGRIVADQPVQEFLRHDPRSDDLWDSHVALVRGMGDA